MRKKLVIFFSTLALYSAFGQDIHFSQYFIAPQLINPAGFGVLNSFEAGLQYKGQWNAFTNGYTSAAVFANKSFRKADASPSKASLAAGLNVVYDKAGSSNLTRLRAEIPVNVTKRVGSGSFLTGGIYLGYGQTTVKSDNFTWGNQFDGYQYNSTFSSNEGQMGQTRSYLDCGVGISHLALKKGPDQLPLNVLGFSISHLNKPNYSLYNDGGDGLGMRINVYDYYHIYLNNSLSVVPSVFLQYQSRAYEVIVGAALKRQFKDNNDPKKSKYASIGVLYRVQDMCALNAVLEMGNYTIGLNYDFNVSSLTSSSRSFGGFEIALKFINPFQGSLKGTSKVIEKKI